MTAPAVELPESARPVGLIGRAGTFIARILLSLFVPFAMFYMNEPFKLDYVWAALCLIGAVYFIFRS